MSSAIGVPLGRQVLYCRDILGSQLVYLKNVAGTSTAIE